MVHYLVLFYLLSMSNIMLIGVSALVNRAPGKVNVWLFAAMVVGIAIFQMMALAKA